MIKELKYENLFFFYFYLIHITYYLLAIYNTPIHVIVKYLIALIFYIPLLKAIKNRLYNFLVNQCQ